jgi:lipid II:glycine glycyltransferase (peptidoglycan interpeptide bridge formation enzyme)
MHSSARAPFAVKSRPPAIIDPLYRSRDSPSLFGFTPYRVVVCDRDRVGALASILVRRSPFGTVMYAPHGPVFADPAAAPLMIDTIRELARKTGALLFRACAPAPTYPILIGAGFRPLADEETVWNTGRADILLDITGSLGDLRRGVRKKNRAYLERSIKCGGVYESSLDPARLYPLLHKNASRQGFSIPPPGYYDFLCDAYAQTGAIEIWFATHQGEDLAGLMTIRDGKTLRLMHLGLNLEGYDRLKPGYGIYWHVVRMAHERGFTSVDWGTWKSDQPPRESDPGYSL